MYAPDLYVCEFLRISDLYVCEFLRISAYFDVTAKFDRLVCGVQVTAGKFGPLLRQTLPEDAWSSLVEEPGAAMDLEMWEMFIGAVRERELESLNDRQVGECCWNAPTLSLSLSRARARAARSD